MEKKRKVWIASDWQMVLFSVSLAEKMTAEEAAEAYADGDVAPDDGSAVTDTISVWEATSSDPDIVGLWEADELTERLGDFREREYRDVDCWAGGAACASCDPDHPRHAKWPCASCEPDASAGRKDVTLCAEEGRTLDLLGDRGPWAAS